jgi:hypothetical protein
MAEACRAGPVGAYVEALDQREASPGEVKLRRADELFSVLSTA